MRGLTLALSAALFLGILSLFLTQAFSSSTIVDAATADGSKRNLEAQALMRSRVRAAEAAATSADSAIASGASAGASVQPPTGLNVARALVDSSSSSATPSDAASEHLSSHATTPTTDEKRAAAGCEGERRPYHTVLTSSSGGYQTWQCRVMFHHWKLQKRRDPCGEMGGFTRLLTSHSGNRDGRSFDDEIPTFYVKELSGGAARGYVVANRPYSMTQFVQHADFRKVVTEEYVYIAETDHVMLRPLPNLATAQMPAGFNFGYMVAWGQAKIVDKFVPGLGGKTDPVGPSPIIIHVEQLVKIVQPWYDFTLKICDDREAVQALGWVREMWGWCIAAGSLGIKHRVLDAFQYEGGSIGNRERPLIWPVGPTPVTPERAEMPYYILHYTYGIEYSAEGLPMELQVGEWSLDKRHYMGQHPPKGLLTPPKCAHDRAHVLSGLINNASATLGERWPGGGGQTDRFNRVELRGHPLRSHAVASKLLGTGPWMLSGRDGGSGAYRLEKMWILNNGWLNSGKGHGRWGLLPKKGGGDGYEDDAVVLQICQRRITVKAVFSASEAWTLVDADDATHVIGKLEAPAEALELWRQPVLTPTSELAARVEGSGPFRGGSTGAIVLLRAGVLAAEGGPYMRHTRWRALEASSGREAIALGGADLGAEASTHAITADFTDCWILRFPERRAGGLLPAAEPAGRPPRYGDGVSARSAEWILQPSATLCKDVCAGLTLRPMTDADHAGSIAARSLEGCCGFSWAGFGGMKLEPNGVLKTPWGSGRWGAPPEAQGTDEGAFLAEFAGFKHLVRVRITSEAGGKRAHKQMQSTRCSDNDRSNVMVTDGEPKLIAS